MDIDIDIDTRGKTSEDKIDVVMIPGRYAFGLVFVMPGCQPATSDREV